MKTLRPSLSQALKARHATLLSAYPMLKRSTMGPKRLPSDVLAAKNIERLLANRFPKVDFQVRLDPAVTSNAVSVEWIKLPDAPSLEEVGSLVSMFKSEHLPARQPGQAPDPAVLSKHAFWVLFGFVGEVVLQQRPATVTETVVWNVNALENYLPAGLPDLVCPRF